MRLCLRRISCNSRIRSRIFCKSAEASRGALFEQAAHRPFGAHAVEDAVRECVGEVVGRAQLGERVLRAIPAEYRQRVAVGLRHNALRVAE